MRRAVFLDRDGTITEEGDWCVKVDPPRLMPGALEALRRLQEAGYLLFVVTNQSGVARGHYTEQDVRTFHRRLEGLCAEGGVRFEEIAYCPHLPDEGCNCRKPDTRWLADAATRYDVDLEQSYVVGDQTTDVAMGLRNGCRTILVQTGFGGRDGKLDVRPDLVAADLAQAADQILAATGTGSP